MILYSIEYLVSEAGSNEAAWNVRGVIDCELRRFSKAMKFAVCTLEKKFSASARITEFSVSDRHISANRKLDL